MHLKFANSNLELDGRYLSAELRDCNDIRADADALRRRLSAEGYLLVRGLHDRQQVLAARRHILEHLATHGLLKSGTAVEDGICNAEHPGGTSTTAMQNAALAQSAPLDAIVKGARGLGFFEHLFGQPVISFDYRWLRTAGTGASSRVHCDRVFMGRGSTNLLSCWTPLDDIGFDMGPLVLCLKSHRIEAIKSSYAQSDVDRDLIAGHFTEDPLELVDRFGARWATTEFRAGDAIIFNMYILHASLVNISDKVRISIDTRYQPASEPADERWYGSNPTGHYAWQAKNAKVEALADSRARWGV